MTRLPHSYEPLARLLLRAEGVASSSIEGVRAPTELVAVAEADAGAVDATSAWVADNLAVVDASLVHARSSAALTSDDLHRWHARLMAQGALPDELVGHYRRVQNWIGGPSPRQAAYVPPPPEHVARLMRDLIRVTNSSKLDPVTLAAVVHAQFEAIHPYGDGDGRLGRVMLGWVLMRSAARPTRSASWSARPRSCDLDGRLSLSTCAPMPPPAGCSTCSRGTWW